MPGRRPLANALCVTITPQQIGWGKMEYAVKAETREGEVMILRKGFASEEEAEDHPIRMSLWKRVWVEPIKATRSSCGPINQCDGCEANREGRQRCYK